MKYKYIEFVSDKLFSYDHYYFNVEKKPAGIGIEITNGNFINPPRVYLIVWYEGSSIQIDINCRGFEDILNEFKTAFYGE